MRHLLCSLLLAATLPALAADVAAPATPAADPYALLAAFDFGQDRTPLNQIDQEIRTAGTDAKALAAIEAKLVAALGQPGLKPGAQDYLCRALAMIGTEHCVPAVAGLLADEKGADLARLALERLPVPAAGDALRAALPRLTGRARLGVINSLGVRREAASVRPLLPLLADPDAATVRMAARALGQIGGDAALAGLLKIDRLDLPEVADAVLACADQLPASDAKQASDTYLKVLSSKAAPVLLEAAFAGLARTQPKDAGTRLLDLLASANPAAPETAIRLARRVRVDGFAAAAAARLHTLPPATQAKLLALLGDLGDAAAQPAVLRQTKSPDDAVRLAAVEALGGLPAARDAVAALARIAGTGGKSEAQAAAKSLARMQGDGLDAWLLDGADKGPAAERRAYVAALGERQTAGADRVLLALRADADGELRRAALKALEKFAAPAAHAAVVAWMLGANDAQEARDAERLAVRLGAQAPQAVSDLIAADAQATAAGKEMLARCLAKRGGDAALKQVRAYLAGSDAAVALGAVRALGTWPDAAPLDDLLAVVAASGDPRRANLAVQGSLQLLALDKRRTADEKAAVCSTLLEKARPDARKLVLGALGDYPCPKATELATALIGDPQCGAEAKAALRRLRQASLGAPTLTASHNAGELKNATDGNAGSRWTTGTGMAPGQWLQLDLHASCTVRRIVLDAASSSGDFPRGYQVFVGDQPDALGAAVLTGQGNGALTELTLDPPRRGRYVKIVQTGSEPNLYWSVHELKVEAELADDAT